MCRWPRCLSAVVCSAPKAKFAGPDGARIGLEMEKIVKEILVGRVVEGGDRLAEVPIPRASRHVRVFVRRATVFDHSLRVSKYAQLVGEN